MRCEKGLFLRLSFVFAATIRNSIGVDRHWLPDLEWRTESNWIGGRLPDSDSQVIFPAETWHTVGLPYTGKVEVAEIVLPREGSLGLGTDGILTASTFSILTAYKKYINVKNAYLHLRNVFV